MGSFSSSTKTNEQKVADVDQKEKEKLILEYKKQEVELMDKVSSIKKSLTSDEGMPNLVLQFSEMLELEGNNTNCVETVVEEMKKKWKVIEDNMQYIEQKLGKPEVDELRNLRFSYWSLLLRTKTANSGLMKECKIQKENVEDLLNILKKAKENGNFLTNEEKLEYNDCIDILSKWVDQRELNEIMQSWHELLNKLEGKRCFYAKLYEKYQKYANRGWWCKIAIAVGAICAIGAILTLIILTSGAGAAIAAGLASTVKIGPLAIVTSHLIGTSIGFGVGAVIFTGAVIYGKRYEADNKLIYCVKEIKNLLQQMLESGKIMTEQLNEININANEVNHGLKFLNNLQSTNKMVSGLKGIDEHLAKYLENGVKVEKVIEKACKDYIQQK